MLHVNILAIDKVDGFATPLGYNRCHHSQRIAP